MKQKKEVPKPKFNAEKRIRPHPRKRWKLNRGYKYHCANCGIHRPLAGLTRLDLPFIKNGERFGDWICSDENGRTQKCGRY